MVIAIARQGLFAGVIADLLGMKVFALEIHAHNRKKPLVQTLSPIGPRDIAGKRVLIVDDDAISGATIKAALKFLAPKEPAAIGAYFQYDLSLSDQEISLGVHMPRSTVEAIRKMGVAVHLPKTTPLAPSYRAFLRIHDTLNTPLGQFSRVATEIYDHIIRPGMKTKPEAAAAIRRHLEDTEEFYFNLNQFLPGVDKVRGGLVMRLRATAQLYTELSTSLGAGDAFERLAAFVNVTEFPPLGFAEDLAITRYLEEGRRLARERHVEIEHTPHSFVAPFRNAQDALKDGYDVALIVGPEGFAYEPIFRDLGIPTVAVNIPESAAGGPRTLSSLDDLSSLKGKRVLVVEDDIQTGATLRKLLEAFGEDAPSKLGLYLASPGERQVLESVPAAFQNVYVTTVNIQQDDAAFLQHLMSRETLFKDEALALKLKHFPTR